MKTVGFIGTGNMGSALAIALSKSDKIRLVLSNRTREKAEELAKKIGASVALDNNQVAKSDFVFIGVKPNNAPDLLKDISKAFSSSSVIVSMVSGLTIKKIKETTSLGVIRIMPNIPVSVGKGVTLYSSSDDVSEDDLSFFLDFMSYTGETVKIDEQSIDAATALSGCGPAFVAMFIDSLADGAVKAGLQRKQAIELACQTLIGTSELILQSAKHPDEVKDDVCSPKGSTIEGVVSLESSNFRSKVIDAVIASYNKIKG